MSRLALFFCLLVLSSNLTLSAHAQVDAHTLLSLRFENSLIGEGGEGPVSSPSMGFLPGVAGQAANFPAGSQLSYQSANNINSKEGIIEFWIKPNWDGTVNPPRTILNWNGTSGGGMTIDVAFGDLALIMDKFLTSKAVRFDVRGWRAGEWHYVAVTYSNLAKIQQIYVDGVLKKQNTFTGELPAINNPNFLMGISGFYPTTALDAQLDEFRISDRVRTGEEIAARYLGHLEQLTVTNLSTTTMTRKLWPTWKIPVVVTAATNLGSIVVGSNIIPWSSSNPTVAKVNALGEVEALSPGTTTITGSLAGRTSSIDISVVAPPLPPKVKIETGPIASLPSNSLYEVPVVNVRYIPTADGINLDTSWAPFFYSLWPVTLAELEADLDRQDATLKFMHDESSRFRGYGSQAPVASIGRRIIATITVYEPPPPGPPYRTINGLPIYNSDHFEIFERLDLRSYINEQGVKQVWLSTPELLPDFPSYDPAIHLPENMRGGWESNMASPTTTDVSNSDQDNTDLPIYNQTYIVNGRPTRGVGINSTHADGHQLEYMYRYVNTLRNGSDNLFTPVFQGTKGRAGSIHNPPNADFGYDYHNYNPVSSDITDRRPDNSGVKIQYNAATVRDTPYIFPNNYLPTPRVDPHWYVFWKQSIPGYGNVIPYTTPGSSLAPTDGDLGPLEICVSSGPEFASLTLPSRTSQNFKKSFDTIAQPYAETRMTNWWQFVADWDRAIKAGVGLYEPANCSYSLSGNTQSFTAAGGNGSVTVSSSTGCKWFASNNAVWTPLTSGDIGNGPGQVNFTVQPNATSSPRSTKIIVAGQPFAINQEAGQIQVAVSGRVMTPSGNGLKNAIVSIIDPSGGRRTSVTSTLGYYSFDGVNSGLNYSISVASRRYRFAPLSIAVAENLANVDFVGLE